MVVQWRGRLRRGLLVASCLAISVASAGCATQSLWRDNRTHQYDAVDGVRAFRLPSDAQAFVVALDDQAVARLRAGAPGCAVAGWLRVGLPPDAAAEEVLAHPTVELWLVHEPGARATWFLGERPPLQKLVLPTSPTRMACTVTPLPAEPSQLGDAVEHVKVFDVVVLDDGTPLPVRIAATPLAVALDGVLVAYCVAAVPVALVLSPITLLVHAIESAGDDDDQRP